MSIATFSPAWSATLHPNGRPTTVRLSAADLNTLDSIRKETTLTRNGLIGLAVAAMLDHVARTGKLPCPKGKKRTKGGVRVA